MTLDAVAARCADPAIADDLKYVLATANALAAGRYQVAYCPSLVRGQGYYTGMVFEITCPQFSGAVAGGGRYDNMVGKFLGTQVPAVGFSIGFERVRHPAGAGYQIPGAKQKIALLYGKDADFPAVLSKAAALRDTYNVTVLQQAKKLGKQLGQLEAAGFAGAAFMDKDEVKILHSSNHKTGPAQNRAGPVFTSSSNGELHHAESSVDAQQRNALRAAELALEQGGHRQQQHDRKHHRNIHHQRGVHASNGGVLRDGKGPASR